MSMYDIDPKVRNEVLRVLADPLSWPKEMKDYLGRYLELDQPMFRLQQIHGWKAYVGNNTSAQCSAPVALTTTPQTVTGCEIEVSNAGLYQVTGIFEFEHGTGVSATRMGLSFPTATANIDRGAGAWSDTDNIMADDANLATVPTSATGSSDFLYATHLGFDIAPTATVDGIFLQAEASETQGAGDGWILNVELLKDGVAVGDIKQAAVPDGSALAEYNFGDVDDLWGETWTAADIADVDFGMRLWATSFSSATEDVAVNFVVMDVFGTGLWETARGYLYVDSDPQDTVVQVQESGLGYGISTTSSGTWVIETTGPVTLSLRADKAYGGGLVEAETGTTLSVIRIN